MDQKTAAKAAASHGGLVLISSYRRHIDVKREPNDEKKQFAARLTGLMLDKGLTSERAARSGVDVSVVSRLLDVTFEMARRYCGGTAMPGPTKIRKLSAWLGVRAAWLQYGEGPKWAGQNDVPGDVDPETIEFAKKISALRGRDRSMLKSMLDAITANDAQKPKLRVHSKK